ncbi:hypothetical protein LTR57_002474 [Friedmanniomyces endolithicus]|nr:hypothetical protein LTR57_002474 [Friedmanniomyces endolithicus]
MARSNSITSISSISSRSSRASSTEAEPTMQIFVKDVAGDTFPLTVPQSTTVSTLRKLLALRTNLPELSLRIIHAGKHLPPLQHSRLPQHRPRKHPAHRPAPPRRRAPQETALQRHRMQGRRAAHRRGLRLLPGAFLRETQDAGES